MTDVQRQAAAKQFVETWTGRGDEKQETQTFWISLLQTVFGVTDIDAQIKFEVPVKLSNTSFIDAYLPQTKVLIEQKGKDVNLKRAQKQSDGSMLTPYQQARRYAGFLPHDQNPRWIVVCNFQEFQIYDMNRPNSEPDCIQLSELEKECYRLQFLVDTGSEHLKREMEVSIAAGDIVGLLYDAFAKQYTDPGSERAMKSLNILCVRLVFCLYAEDAGVFGRRGMFRDYLAQFEVRHMRKALIELFHVLDTPDEKRDPYMEETLAAFPYVNGGLFEREDIEIPNFTEEIRTLLLEKASQNFDWSEISPTIFGAVFESTLNPETRRKGGMHYTSIENIHKVIDPLFLNDLRAELDDIKSRPAVNPFSGTKGDSWRPRYLENFQKKLASLRFLDPACGSGNFLTESYLCLRRLENEVIRELRDGTAGQLGMEAIVDAEYVGIQVSISQFYGIEINDFAVTVAKTALWIAESQMMKETEAIVQTHLDFLPLKTNAYIVEGNALRMDWESVVPKHTLSYIMGNPPFVGARLMDKAQKADVNAIFSGWKNVGNLDYVSCWYKKAAELMRGTEIRAALVSTNSVSQGEMVANLWKPLFEADVHIDFAYRTFRWDSEANAKAHVHCVIIGFSTAANEKLRVIYTDNRPKTVQNINGYLLEADNIFVESRKKPICDVPEIGIGNMPLDGGNYLFTEEEKADFIKSEPLSEKWFRPWIGSHEFINRYFRYCLYLKICPPNELRKMPECMKRVEAVRQFRAKSSRASTKKLADYPLSFSTTNIPAGNYIVVPKVSSERRRYIPIGLLDSNILSSDLVFVIPDATLYHFGVLTSNVHMAWMRAVCGRLKSDYRYSKDIVYNNFPWPEPTDAQRAKIEQTAQAILDARALYPDSSLADLYDELTMPPELRRAHQQNDKAVMRAYGITPKDEAFTSESACVARLMKLYQQLTKS